MSSVADFGTITKTLVRLIGAGPCYRDIYDGHSGQQNQYAGNQALEFGAAEYSLRFLSKLGKGHTCYSRLVQPSRQLLRPNQVPTIVAAAAGFIDEGACRGL